MARGGLAESHMQPLANALGVHASLTECNLLQNELGVEGWTIVFNALCDSPTSKITKWDLFNEQLGPEIAKPLAEYISVTASLTECDVRSNNLNKESATLLAKNASEKRIMLFGIKHDQTEADLRYQGLGPEDAILIASDLTVSASITSMDLSRNRLCSEGAKALAPGISANASITSVNVLSNYLDVESANLLLKVKAEKPNLRTLCGLTHNEAELDLHSCGLGPGDAKLLAPEILVVASLTSLNLADNILCGVDAFGRGTYSAEGIKAIADALRVCACLTRVDVRNGLDDDAKRLLQAANSERSSPAVLEL